MRTDHLRTILLTLTISACAFSKPPDVDEMRITAVSGDGQQGVAGTTLKEPFIVLVQDRDQLPIGNLTIDFRVVTSNGVLSTASERTDAVGHVRTTLTLDSKVGENIVEAQANSSDTRAVFTAMGIPGDPVNISVWGDQQTQTVGQLLPTPLAVTVTDANGNPVSNVTVAFEVTSGNGSIETMDTSTDPHGEARASLRLGATAGLNTVRMESTQLPGSPPTFAATGIPDIAVELVRASPNTQTGVTGAPLSFAVTPRDQYGNAVPGVDVTFAVTSGIAYPATTVVTTDTSGRADVTLTPITFESIGLEASATGLAGSPLVFNAMIRSFAPSPPVATQNQPIAIAAADLDGDGRDDIVVAGNNGLKVFRNATQVGSTTSTFSPGVDVVASSVMAIAIGEINGDSKPDIVVGIDNSSLVVLLNTSTNSALSFHLQVGGFGSLNGAHSHIVIIDMNNDGKNDIITGVIGYEVRIFVNTTPLGAVTADFNYPAILALPGMSALVVADLDGNNRPDIIMGNYSQISILWNTTISGLPLTFSGPNDFSVGGIVSALAVADISADNKPDLIFIRRGAAAISVMANTSVGTLSFGPRLDFPTVDIFDNDSTPRPSPIALGHVNGDQRPDIIVANRLSNTFSILVNLTSGSTPNFAPHFDRPTGNLPSGVALANINKDARLDLVAVNRGSSSFSCLLAEP